MQTNRQSICGGSTPADIECRTTESRIPYYSTSDVLDEACTVSGGLVCLNSNQSDSMCKDYQVRYKCLVTKSMYHIKR